MSKYFPQNSNFGRPKYPKTRQPAFPTPQFSISAPRNILERPRKYSGETIFWHYQQKPQKITGYIANERRRQTKARRFGGVGSLPRRFHESEQELIIGILACFECGDTACGEHGHGLEQFTELFG